MLGQLTLDDLQVQEYKGYARKVEIPEIRLACSQCHVLVSKECLSCRHCGALFVEA